MIENTEHPIIQRLKRYIETTGLSVTQFADKAGIPRPTFSQLLNGRNKTVNNQLLSRLDENFPDLDIVWLLFGRGDMRKGANIEISEPQMQLPFSESNVQNTVNEDVSASASSFFDEMESSQNSSETASEGQSGAKWHASVLCTPPDGQRPDVSANPEDGRRRISSIIVLYSDNSFETFYP